MKKILFFAFLFIGLGVRFFLSEWAMASTSSPLERFEAVSLEGSHSYGQTFLSRYRGLNGIEIYLFPASIKQGRVELHLQRTPQPGSTLGRSSLPLIQITKAGFYFFPFQALSDSTARDYYLLLTLEGSGRIGLGVQDGDKYFEGSLYQDEAPVNRQMVFRLHYDRGEQVLGLVREGGRWLVLLGFSVWLFIIPGWALLYFWPGHSGLSWAEKLGLSVGLSLALYPILFLWTDLMGVHLGPWYAWLLPVLGFVTILGHNRSRRPINIKTDLVSWVHSNRFWPDMMILVLTGLVFFTRFFAIRILDFPLGGDSYHHTVISQLLVDHRGLFDSWGPYASLESFTYHFGFHSAVAVFHWLSGLELPQACLWTGQILNGGAVLALIPLTMKISNNRWAALGPLLVAGVLAPMPMFYVNWGRYTQLAGQVILPGAAFVLWCLLESEQLKWKGYLVGSIMLSGLALSHYRVAFFALSFILSVFLMDLSLKNIKQRVKRTSLLALGGGILFFPWFWHVFSGKIAGIFASQITTATGRLSDWEKLHNAIGPLTSYLPVYLWLFLAFFTAWGLWTRRRALATIVLWWCLTILLACPEWVGLPGTGIINSFAVFIALYIPTSLMVGFFLGRLAETAGRRFSSNFLTLFFCLPLLGLGLWGVKERLTDINRKLSPVVTGPDLRAAQWIRQNTSPQDLFLVNSVFAYDNSIIVGMDAGWWLPLTANRKTTLPPMLYVTEKGPRPDYEHWINGLIAQVQTRGLENTETLNLLTQRGITHLYVGQRAGRIGLGSLSIDPTQLEKSSWYKPVYHRDRVWIFSLTRPAKRPFLENGRKDTKS